MINLADEIDSCLLARLVRMMELDPTLEKADALARLERIADESGVSAPQPRLAALAGRLVRHGVLNPRWLEKHGLHTHFFLVNGRPGFLQQLVRNSAQDRLGVSYHLVYGDWDAFVVLYGTAAEAAQFHAGLQVGIDAEPTHFSAERVLITYRQHVRELSDVPRALPTNAANALARDFYATDGETRARLLSSGHLLGSTWFVDGRQPYPVMAFVGLSLNGRANISADAVRDALLQHDTVRQSLVHLYQIRQGRPFHFLLKLCCLNVQELDEVSNTIGFTSLGNVRFEGATLVVSGGIDQLPMLRRADVHSLSPGPDLTPMMRAAERVFARLPADQQDAFNRLDANRQITVVKSLAELGDRIDAATVNASTRQRLESALSTFSRECIVNAHEPSLTGAATEVTAAVEGALKRLLSRLAYATYGRDPARIQRELRLPTRAIRNLTLGRVIQALRMVCEHDAFVEPADLIDDSWLDRIDRFADARNRWAHDAVSTGIDETQVIDEAHHTIVEAIDISGWIESRLDALSRDATPAAFGMEPGEVPLDVAPAPRGRELGVFISYATGDKQTADRIAMGLKAFGHRSFYSDLEMQPGDSILSRIESALAQSDTLLVLLSARSVESGWVRRELNTALMGQLSGHDIRVIPVLIGDCTVPELLKETLHVDMRSDFEEGLFTLLTALRQRRRAQS